MRQLRQVSYNARAKGRDYMATLVMKFGGSLSADARRLSRVAQVIMAESLAWNRMVVVVSAMAGVTDLLRRAVEDAAGGRVSAYRRTVARVRADHMGLIDTLIRNRDVHEHLVDYLDRRLFEVMKLCDHVSSTREATNRERDAAMARGEYLLTHILAALVQQEGLRAAPIDPENIIITDHGYQNAHPVMDLIEERVERVLQPLLAAKIVPLIAGFVGATTNGILTTLGRGGSDYTATLLAAALRAEEVWVWTNVDGVMSADPVLVPGARVIPVLSYEEIGELSYFGARVLHPSAVEPLIQRGIPLRVRNPDNLDHAGTLIQTEAAEGDIPLKAVTAVDGLCLSVSNQPFDLIEFLNQVQHAVGKAATGPVIVMQSHHRATLVFVVPTSEGPNAVDNAAKKLASALPRWSVEPVKVIAAIGAPATWKPQFESEPLAMAIGPGRRRLIAVQPNQAKNVVRQLHKLAESESQNSTLPPQIWPRWSERGS